MATLAIGRPKILEVGCGTGWLTEKLATYGHCTAVDLSGKAISIAKQRMVDAEFIAGDFCELKLPESHFDIGIVVETVAYVQDQQSFVDKLASHVRPGGYVILTSVNKFVYERRGEIGPPKEGQIRQWLTLGEFRRLLRPSFRILLSATVLPKGDRGILRLVNSHKLNSLLASALSQDS